MGHPTPIGTLCHVIPVEMFPAIVGSYPGKVGDIGVGYCPAGDGPDGNAFLSDLIILKITKFRLRFATSFILIIFV